MQPLGQTDRQTDRQLTLERDCYGDFDSNLYFAADWFAVIQISVFRFLSQCSHERRRTRMANVIVNKLMSGSVSVSMGVSSEFMVIHTEEVEEAENEE